MDTIGSRLRHERKLMGLTQREAAQLSGISSRAWNAYERDVRSPSAITLAAFCRAGADAAFILVGKFSRCPIKQALIETGFIKNSLGPSQE